MHFFRWIGTVAALACFTIPVQADDGPPPSQQHSAEACGEDSKCLTLWYFEYKDGIIKELLFWRQFENDIADRNTGNVLDDLSVAIQKMRYKHNHWDFYRGKVFQVAGQPELETLIVPDTYLSEVRECEQQFRLPKFNSRLRRF